MAESAQQLLGSRIRALRLSAILSQEELARQVGVSRSTIARWESGTRDITFAMLVQVSAALNTTLVELMTEPSQTPTTNVSALSVGNETSLNSLERHSIELIISLLVGRPQLIPAVLTAIHKADSQVSSESHEEDVISARLRRIELNELTPIAAFGILVELQSLVRSD